MMIEPLFIKVHQCVSFILFILNLSVQYVTFEIIERNVPIIEPHIEGKFSFAGI